MRQLHIDHNKFTGTLPSNYINVGNGRLTSFSIDHNKLTGIVPYGGSDRVIYDTLVHYTLHENLFTSLETEICQNNLMVEFKADCIPKANVCLCYGRFWKFCDRWCGSINDDDFDGNFNNNNNNNPGRNPSFDSNPVNWQQQQQQNSNNWQQQQPNRNPNNNWSF